MEWLLLLLFLSGKILFIRKKKFFFCYNRYSLAKIPAEEEEEEYWSSIKQYKSKQTSS